LRVRVAAMMPAVRVAPAAMMDDFLLKKVLARRSHRSGFESECTIKWVD
jgi:hypothetical protein